jgi:hypothetical protein
METEVQQVHSIARPLLSADDQSQGMRHPARQYVFWETSLADPAHGQTQAWLSGVIGPAAKDCARQA